MEENYFGVVDYLVFLGMLVISMGIGVFYACKGQKSTSDVLVGGKSMGVWPIAASIMATFMSAAGLLGTPSEIYLFGTQPIFGYILIIMPLITFLTSYYIVPVFYNLGECSSNSYFEKRFGRPIRILACSLYILTMIFFTGVALFAPAMALAQVTGITPWIVIWGTGLAVTFYTTIGGMKAVVWTDAFQSIVMLVAMIWIMAKGISDNGGFAQVWKDNVETDRIQFFHFDPSPYVRVTFWSNIFGGTVAMLGGYGTSQATVQRYLSLPTLADAKKSMWMTLPMFTIIWLLTVSVGMVVVSRYRGCDPILTQRVMTADQLFPLFVMDTMGSIPGLPGIFVAGMFSASMSTVSSTINAVTAVILEDIVKLIIWPKITEEQSVKLLKVLCAGFGLLCIGAATVAGSMGNIVQASMVVFGLLGAPMFGTFMFGLFVPVANNKGALAGIICGFVFNCWMGIGALINRPFYHMLQKDFMDTCPNLYFNVTGKVFDRVLNDQFIQSELERTSEIFPIYRISFMYYMLIGCFIVMGVGTIVSLLTGGIQAIDTMNTNLLVPLVKDYVDRRQKRWHEKNAGARFEVVTMLNGNTKRISSSGA